MTQIVKRQSEERIIPIVALRGSVVFPGTESILTFGRPKTKAAVNAAYSTDRLLGIFTQKDSRVVDPTPSELYQVGTLAVIEQVMPTESEIHVLVSGKARVRIKEVVGQHPFLIYKVEELFAETKNDSQEEALARHLTKLFEKGVKLGKPADVQTVMRLLSAKIPSEDLADQVASLLDVKTEEKQELLEQLNLVLRLQKVTEHMAREVEIFELERTISSKTQKRFQEQMRRTMLKEHQRTIQEELKGMGEEEEDVSEAGELKKKIKEAKMPKEVAKKAEKELKRLNLMPASHPETGYIRNYLDWLCEVPWSARTPNNVSIKNAIEILDNDHYALKKTKERIIEFLAVMKLKGQLHKNNKKTQKKDVNGNNPTILCFVGPPGVGKTSIGRSIARALGRKFVRISLGGVRDEAEIRGHRRTYVGALPGRIIQGMKTAGTKNPVFMLDEIDKLGTDFRGDPSSALLEVLDPEQNKEFSDHYLEVPYDLSEVMFILTANTTDSIPPALKDRMEIIRFSGYTTGEKYFIAKNFLWGKQLKNHALPENIETTPGALREIIENYTREAGVRNLERNLAAVARKIARKAAEGKKVNKKVAKEEIRTFLGPRQFSSLLAEKKGEVGMVTGLAFTQSGGEIIFIETALMPGKGRLTLTGQLGDVMKESAMAAFSYAKSHWQDFGIAKNFSQTTDVHLHVPEGAVPKDGPSAGVAMATSLISALTHTKVKTEVGMTGEITLRGRIMEIGGVKEKVIAGHRAGLKTIIIPKDNKKDMEDIPAKVKKDIRFVFADHLDNVLKVAFEKKQEEPEIIPSPGTINHTPVFATS